MPHIFEPFYTSATGRAAPGLGLAIARELADPMSGELSVRSGAG
jgi:signal transduction histidine kinase